LHELHNPSKINDMDENTKLYVFSKREVALIFLFMFLIALTSFVFGVKVGKNYSFEQSGFLPQDKQKVDLLSGQEEKVNEVVREKMEKPKDSVELNDLNKKLEQHIKTETDGEGKRFEGKPEADEPAPSQPSEADATTQDSGNQMIEPVPGTEVTMEEGAKSSLKDQYSGKYTIQLGSHRSIDEAEAFAEGFKVRGYNPIINEVEIPNRGVWYRVSLGVFDTITDAKDYVKKEQSLFQGQDYVFVRFD
jgi:septal ring-binding cell division protein DamX